jgi:hypothetical protein
MRGGRLKVRLCQFGFYQERTKPHINFGIVAFPVGQRRPWLEPKLGNDWRTHPEDGLDQARLHELGITEDIHEKSIRAMSAIQLLPLPVGARSGAFEGCVDFIKPLRPLRVVADSLVGKGMKIAMSTMIIRSKENAGNGAIGLLIRELMTFRKCQCAGSEFCAKA